MTVEIRYSHLRFTSSPQVSFSAPPPLLSNRKRYGTFSMLPSDRAVNQAAVKLLQRYRWSRVGVLTQEGAQRSEMRGDLARQLLKADVHVVSSESFSADACSSLRKIRGSDARIIVALLDGDSAAEVFCCAYRLKLFGARYQWLLLLADGGADGWRWGGAARLQRRQPAGGCRRSHAAAEEGAQQLGGAGDLRTGQDSHT
ncbi:hypothetical protein CgunFtcFv8_018994 [Champsocephalus gunnari]|uniref:Receptor ligand binding region domain-containing protein n=1 Tax=Champsocephalus gunnari TaxID=52237 RepID=A0AAN8DF69_CHAGU|nr:hypothetical protein CgunFtcFv8_018994 [Champsocephalus gunnari]